MYLPQYQKNPEFVVHVAHGFVQPTLTWPSHTLLFESKYIKDAAYAVLTGGELVAVLARAQRPQKREPPKQVQLQAPI